MWTPTSVQDLETVVRLGSLEETEIFDAKKEIASSKSLEIAKDIASMANEGGVLIYGIGEDEHKRPTILNPVPLAGERERINSIVQTSIAEPPRVIISTLATEGDPAIGYIIVAVPPSERAPHMVIVKGDNRFYGRTATGNIPLTQGQVEQLYERRRRWEVNREELLSREVRNAPLAPHPNYGYLHLFAQPVARRDGLLNAALRRDETAQLMLSRLVSQVVDDQVFPRDQYHPDFGSTGTGNWNYRTEGLLVKLSEPMSATDLRAPRNTLNLQIDFDGSGHLFCGYVAEHEQASVFYTPVAAGNTARFLALMGMLYDRARYTGMVDLGIAIIGIKDTFPHSKNLLRSLHLTAYDRDEYRQTVRVSAQDLVSDSNEAARQLLLPLFTAMYQRAYDPFPKKEERQA